MSLTRHHAAKWINMLLLSCTILLLSYSLIHARWVSVTPPTVSDYWLLYDVQFISADEGWAVGFDSTNGKGVLLHYTDGSWVSVTPPSVSDTWELWAVHFTSKDEGWTVGFDSTNGKGLLFHYQGGIWTQVTLPPTTGNWYLYGVHFTSANEGWAVGRDYAYPTDALLHDEGGFWTLTSSGDRYLYGVHFTSADEGWAAGRDTQNASGALLHYTNGSWMPVAPPTLSNNWDLAKVHFTSADEGWAVGNDYINNSGVLLHYTNGSWTSVTPPTVSTYWHLNSLHFTSADEGWAVGYDAAASGSIGLLLHYTNGSWTRVTPPTINSGWHLNGVHFTSANQGWAVGDSYPNPGVLLRYSAPALSPTEGTIGTQITITGLGFGSKKGKVLLGDVAAKKDKALKVVADGWHDDHITCTETKLPEGSYSTPFDVTIITKSKPAETFSLESAFTVKLPEPVIDPDVNDHAAGGQKITITGNFFGTKKGKVYLEYFGKNKNCKVTDWNMNSITFLVPKKLVEGKYPLNITNKVGTVGVVGFTIDPSLP
jgi:hypothetical protein